MLARSVLYSHRFQHVLSMFVAFGIKGQAISCFTHTFLSSNSFSWAKFVTGGISVADISASNLFQKESHFNTSRPQTAQMLNTINT